MAGNGNIIKDSAFNAAVAGFGKTFGILDADTKGKSYLVGNQLSFADLNFLPILFYAAMFPESKATFDASPNLTTYYQGLLKRDSVSSVLVVPDL